MSQKIFLCIIGVLIVLFTGCARQQDQMSYIGAESAKKTALKAALLTEKEISFINADLDTRDGLDYYRVCFEAAGQSYQYDIDALTGVIINAEKLLDMEDSQTGDAELAELTGTADPQRAVEPSPDVSDMVPFRQEVGAAVPTASGTGPDACIGEAEARRIALEHAGLEEGQVTFVSSLLEVDDGQWEYDVEFYTADYEEYDYEIDAYTGAVISFDYDAEHYSQPGSNIITAEQAQQLALAQVPGAAESDIRKFEIDDDDGNLLYEGKIIYNGMEYEFEIDAYSGFIREWSAEPFEG